MLLLLILLRSRLYLIAKNYINDKDVAVTSIEYVAVTILFLKNLRRIQNGNQDD